MNDDISTYSGMPPPQKRVHETNKSDISTFHNSVMPVTPMVRPKRLNEDCTPIDNYERKIELSSSDDAE